MQQSTIHIFMIYAPEAMNDPSSCFMYILNRKGESIESHCTSRSSSIECDLFPPPSLTVEKGGNCSTGLPIPISLQPIQKYIMTDGIEGH